MKKNQKSKYEVMVRLKNNANAYELALQNGFIQIRNGMELPNTNALMNALYDFGVIISENGIPLNELREDKNISRIIQILKYE